MTTARCDDCGNEREVCCSESKNDGTGRMVRVFARCRECCGPHPEGYAIDVFLGLVKASRERKR